MGDTYPTQASGKDGKEGREDGVQDAPGKTSAGGESGGGAHEIPDGGAKGGVGGFFGHGGQSEQDYSGTGDDEDGGDNPNGVKE